MPDDASTVPPEVVRRYRPQLIRRAILLVAAAFVLLLLVSSCEVVPLFSISCSILLVVALVAIVKPRLGALVMMACMLGVGISLLIPIRLRLGVPRVSERFQCHNNLRQIGVALYNYHEAHGCFPPAYLADENGRPMHSWRVLILPQIDRLDLYTQYRFDEPWDGPNNRRLHSQIVEIYRCPATRDEEAPSTTHYLAVVGPGTAWPGSDGLRISDFTDGTSQTILLSEVPDSDVIWCEPRDLHVGQMSPTINGEGGQGISKGHEIAARVLLADANLDLLREDLAPEILRALLSPRGGEQLDAKQWRP